MPAQKKSKSFLEKAQQNGAENDREGINGEIVHRKLEERTAKDYDRAVEMFGE